jgi:hypothetical protein
MSSMWGGVASGFVVAYGLWSYHMAQVRLPDSIAVVILLWLEFSPGCLHSNRIVESTLTLHPLPRCDAGKVQIAAHCDQPQVGNGYLPAFGIHAPRSR